VTETVLVKTLLILRAGLSQQVAGGNLTRFFIRKPIPLPGQ